MAPTQHRRHGSRGLIAAALCCALAAGVLLNRARRASPQPPPPPAAPQASPPLAAAPLAAPAPPDPPRGLGQDLATAAARALRPELWDPSLSDPSAPAPPDPRTDFADDASGPCWRSGGALWCLPLFYLIGVFQGGVRGLWELMHARLEQGTAGPLVRPREAAGEHFTWVEGPAGSRGKWARLLRSTEPAAAAVRGGSSGAFCGDASEAMLTHYWAMSAEAVHGAFHRTMLPCWKNCQRRAPSERRGCIDDGETGCRGAARRAEDAAQRAAGVTPGADGEWRFTIPWLLRGVQGADRIRLVAVLREPVQRLHAAFWHYRHYPQRHNATPAGFAAYVREQIAGFGECVAGGFTVRRCALEFESLLPRLERVFFHCDQLIRGLYSVFVADWAAAFPLHSRLLVLRTEDLAARPDAALRAVGSLLGLRVAPPRAQQPAPLQQQPLPEMLPEAQRAAEGFYADDKRALARMLGDARFLWGGGKAAP